MYEEKSSIVLDVSLIDVKDSFGKYTWTCFPASYCAVDNIKDNRTEIILECNA